ncbi:hypothetical protein [Burkholderia pseudomallei]|uniref:hypothetical protein n=1 Tax=Burkholderia pseudomallei TaxID=28450 RepID=UPI0012B6DB86|nr:hypothetical protein [Burkholderia pseudomallei]MBM5620355.1 hypothetical protein [Burkholderia pseudomallei]MBM5634751.1 hypothetical protein [Burkholderia pseudomallei]MBM5663147.1 hypothetical protein [Burkholderia pseudomallei]
MRDDLKLCARRFDERDVVDLAIRSLPVFSEASSTAFVFDSSSFVGSVMPAFFMLEIAIFVGQFAHAGALAKQTSGAANTKPRRRRFMARH